jgi:hypothetical protein
LIEAPDYNHFEMDESFGISDGPRGRAALSIMKLPILNLFCEVSRLRGMPVRA